MMDSVVAACEQCGIRTIFGYYYPTAKNAMVREFYGGLGFTKVWEDVDGSSKWRFDIPEPYEKKNRVIAV